MCNIVGMKKPRDEAASAPPDGRASATFLIAQLGAHAASRFAARMAVLKLTPAHAGILRILNGTPGVTQQALAEQLGMVPSRLVVLIDEMEEQGFVERQGSPGDRRRYALHLSEKGRSMLEAVGRVAREHSQELLAALSDEEKRQLSTLLQRVADEQGLRPGVHPGYRKMRPSH